MTDFIDVVDDAVDPALCLELTAAFEASAHRRPGRAGGGVDPDKKLSTDLAMDGWPELARPLARLREAAWTHIASYFRRHPFALIAPLALQVFDPATGRPTALTDQNFERVGLPQLGDLMRTLYRIGPVQLQKYDAGRGHYGYWHCEVFPQLPDNEPLHRTLLFMVYLNDVAEGGHTEFFHQGRAIQPRRGRMVIAPAYFTHTHRGTVPVSGDKYIATSWLLLQRAEVLYRPRPG